MATRDIAFDEFIQAIGRCALELGRRPAAADYHAWQLEHEHEPDLGRIRKWLGAWEDALTLVPQPAREDDHRCG